MYKNNFKIGKRKLSGGIFAGLMILGVLSGTVMAGNTTDTFYSYEASGGVWGQTEVRAKQDATSVYVFHKGIIRHILGCIAVPQIILLVLHLLMLQWG